MSRICEHPSCTRLISTRCSNHCQLDLCEEHIIEHKNLFLVQYEKSFNNLNKTLNEVVNSMVEAKNTLHNNHENDVSLINENYNNKLNEIEQKFLFVNSTQILIKKKLQLLNDAKNGQTFLYQYDIEQIKLYLSKIRQYHHDKITKEPDQKEIKSPLTFKSEVVSDIDQLSPKIKCDGIMYVRGRCPLTRIGIYGLSDKHKLRLCSSENSPSEIYLVTHFHRYHHLTWTLSYKLTKAIINNLNPLTTCIFQPELNIIDQRFRAIKCPLNKMKLSNCKRKFSKCSLKKHSLKIHHLPLETSNKIIETIENKDNFTTLDLNKVILEQKH